MAVAGGPVAVNHQTNVLEYSASAAGGAVLASASHLPVADITTASSTFADVNAALAVTFTAPSSGKVAVVVEGIIQGSASTTYAWNLRDGSGDMANTKRAILFNESAPVRRQSATFLVTSLTAGSSYTWKLGHGLAFGTGTCRFSGNNTEQNTITMLVLSVP